ncbi:hypothetical protein KSP40_PGU012798 [Platanthera guangdongensis]|uniref:Homeodomain-like superfamily protein n=1 Tax=Platanthera guangdongensis TaxID=2320717 RepID=A0ABR2M7E2_9ASPA
MIHFSSVTVNPAARSNAKVEKAMTAFRNKGTVSEDDIYSVVQRYGPSTIFSLIHEISQAAEKDVTIDWRTLVKATSTGISNAREYQMLWRHLAYRDPLEKVEEGEEPLSDESDLDFELEATPNPSKEVLAEVDCFVKVLLSSGAVGHCIPSVATTVEAPPTANDQPSVVPPDKQHLNHHNRSTNGVAPPAQKQPLTAGQSANGLDGNDLPNSTFPSKKKRKQWKQQEDMELIAAVEKFGEGNWANILKGDFKHDRTASQLSQRWSIIRKRQDSNPSTIIDLRSEELLAANKTFSMFINMPLPPSLSTVPSGGTQTQMVKSSLTMARGTTGVIDESLDATQAIKKNNWPLNQEPSSHKDSPTVSKKPRVSQKKPQAHLKPSSICPNPLIKAAAFAAGGRIATPSTAASLFKAAQSKNVVRIRHGGAAPSAGPPVTSAATASTMPSPASVSTAPVNAVIGLPHVVNPRFHHSSALKLCQVQGCVGKAPCLPTSAPVQNPPAETRRLPGIIISAVDVGEPLAGETKGTRDKETSDAQTAETGDSSRIRGVIDESQDMRAEESIEVKEKKASSPETTRI